MIPFPRVLADQFPTPFYAYDLDRAEEQVDRLHEMFPRMAKKRLLYALQSNPLPRLAESFRKAGAQAYLSSPSEIEVALSTGFDFSKSLYGGAGKSSQEIETALMSGIRRFTIDSWHEHELIGGIVASKNVPVQGLLRLSPTPGIGFSETELTQHGTRRLGRFAEHLSVEGIHISEGSRQRKDLDALVTEFEKCIDLAERVSDSASFPLHVLNFGSCFWWPFGRTEPEWDSNELREKLETVYEKAGAAKKANWWFETGRFCSGPTGTLVTRVMDMKEDSGRRFVVVDAGIHQLGSMAGKGRIQRPEIELVAPIKRSGDCEKVDLVGKSRTPLDLLGQNQLLPSDLKVGDILTIPNVGAYGASGSLSGLLSRETPLEICYRNREVITAHQIRHGHAEVSLMNFQATTKHHLSSSSVSF